MSGGAHPATPGAGRDAAGQLAALADAFWEATLEDDPVYATSLGDRRYDGRLADHSPAGRDAVRRRRRELLDRVEALDPDTLDDPGRITRVALHEELAGELAALDAGLDDWTVDPLEGLPSGLLTLPEIQRLETVEDGTHLLERWRAIPGYVDTSVAGLRRSLANGRVAPRAAVDRVLDQLDDLLGTSVGTWPLLGPAVAVDGLAGWTDAQRTRFRSELEAVVGSAIGPAFSRLRDVLRDEIAPAARSDDRAGLSHLPDGPAAYRALIRRHTSLDLEAQELHATGLAEIARIDEELRELAARVLGTRTLAEALDHLRSDPSLCFATRDEVEATAARCLARANEAVPDWFGRPPEAPCVVVRMAAHEEEHSTIAYYRPPALDGSRPGQYLINTSAPRTRPRYEAEALAFHEAVPGHHLQIAIGQELTHLPAFRRNLGPTAFVEGWGLYTERLADEMGLYTADLDRIGVLSYDAWRAARLVVDTGLHALGWTRAQAVAFMTEHSALAVNNIANEVDRYIVWPGQALAYKTGQLELVRLREEARARLGSAFDIREFHDTVLGGGALPLTALREVVARATAPSAGPVTG